LLALLACLGTLAFAQIDPGFSAIYQNGVQVGEIYVPACTDQGLYAEHWILYPNYVYVGQGGAEIKIVPVPAKTTRARRTSSPARRSVQGTAMSM
jgi:hypothetical protein